MKKSLLLLAAALCTYSASSQETNSLMDLSLEELMNTKVTVASKKAEKLNDAPGIITVVSQKEIESFAAQTLGDVLNRVVSMNFLSANVFCDNVMNTRAQATTPYDNHVLILMNGRPVRDPITGGLNNVIYTSFPIEFLDHIEIIRGPGSVLYGSCAYAGVINLITKTGKDNATNGLARFSIGSENTTSQTVNFSIKEEDWSINSSFMNYKTDGPEFEFTDYSNRDSSHNFDRKNNSFLTNIIYKDFTLNFLHASYQPYSLNGPDNSWDIKENGRNVGDIETYFADLGYTFKLSETADLSTNLTYNHRYWDQDNGSEIKASDLLFEATAKIAPVENMNLVVGGSAAKIFYDSDRLIGAAIDSVNTSFSLYAQIDYKFAEMFKLIGGLQFNKIKNIDGNVSPRIGVVANVTDEFGVKALYSQAFRKAYPLEIAFNHPVFRGNPTIKPELINTFEAQAFYQIPTLQASITFYSSVMKDRIIRTWYDDPSVPIYKGYLKYGNGGEFKFSGVEFEAKYSIAKELFFTASANYQTNSTDVAFKADSVVNVKDAALHPNMMAKIGFVYDNHYFNLGVFNTYFGEPKNVDILNPSVPQVNKQAEAYSLLSFKLSTNAMKIFGSESKNKLIVAIEGENLLDLDVRYPEFTSKGVNTLLPLKVGRTFYASVNLEF